VGVRPIPWLSPFVRRSPRQKGAIEAWRTRLSQRGCAVFIMRPVRFRQGCCVVEWKLEFCKDWCFQTIDLPEVPSPFRFRTTSGLMSGRAETPKGDGLLPTLRGGSVRINLLNLFNRVKISSNPTFMRGSPGPDPQQILQGINLALRASSPWPTPVLARMGAGVRCLYWCRTLSYSTYFESSATSGMMHALA
jgi:hypothetical protein